MAINWVLFIVFATKETTKPAYITKISCTGDEVIIDQCNITTVIPAKACWKSSRAATAHCRIDRTVPSMNIITISHQIVIVHK